jgi:hypothetical protein
VDTFVFCKIVLLRSAVLGTRFHYACSTRSSCVLLLFDSAPAGIIGVGGGVNGMITGSASAHTANNSPRGRATVFQQTAADFSESDDDDEAAVVMEADTDQFNCE